ncbi:MAG TPA: hypothetical protein VHD32_02375 [Candidatus Didemnitutus sp.]|nr:hypothetical protein [Candidatus Didemnitutus sp.]
MNDLIQTPFIDRPPGPAAGSPDPLWPVRRSFGEDDPAPSGTRSPARRPRQLIRRKRVPVSA